MRATAICLVLLISMAAAPASLAAGADEVDSEVASRWAEMLYQSTQELRLSPPVASRCVGYFGVTLHEAVAPGRGNGMSLVGQLNGLTDVPRPDPSLTYDWRLVANNAAAACLSHEFRESSKALARIEQLRSTILHEISQGVPTEVVKRSQAHGCAVADAISAWAERDGHARASSCKYVPPAGHGLWEPTPLSMNRALEPCWSGLRPFIPATNMACAPPPPTPYSTDPTSLFMKEAREVKDMVDHLTPEQRDIALFWADDRGVSGTPSGHWLLLVAQLSRERKISLGVACEAHARMGIALAEAFLSCWRTKYERSYVRPVTIIQREIDRSWLPLLNTPPFPEYTSGHSVASGAAARVLTDLFGVTPFTDHVNDFRGLRARSFDSFEDAAREAAMSRLYGGIHFRPSIENGLAQGDCVGRTVDETLRFTGK